MPIALRSLHRAPAIIFALALALTAGAVALGASIPAIVLFGSLAAAALVAVVIDAALATTPAVRTMRFTTRRRDGNRPVYAHARSR